MFDLYGMCEEIAITDTHSYSSSINQNIHLTENVSSKVKMCGLWNENEVAGFLVFSQWILIGYFRLGQVK